MKSAVAATESAYLVEGCLGSGKTAWLVDRVCELIRCCSEDILVLCATEAAVRSFRERLSSIMSNSDKGVHITTAKALGLEIIRTPECEVRTRRAARVLLPCDEAVLFEDLKVSGVEESRLASMLSFFYKSWTELADFEDGFLINDEEVSVHDLVKECLADYGGMLDSEISNLAWRFLNEDEDGLRRFSVDHVLVDDYQCLNRASQLLVNLIAKKTIAVAFNSLDLKDTIEPFPYDKGVDEFVKGNPQAKRISLMSESENMGSVLRRRLRNSVAEQAKPGPRRDWSNCGTIVGALKSEIVEVLEGETIAEEFSKIVCWIKERITSGAEPSNIWIAAPNHTWASTCRKELSRCSIDAEVEPSLEWFCGSSVDSLARILTAVRLAADQNDGIAWRTWCGFDDALANSNAFRQIRKLMRQAGLTLPQALAFLTGDHIVESGRFAVDKEALPHEMEKLGERFTAMRNALPLLVSLRGEELMQAVVGLVVGSSESKIPAAFAELSTGVGKDCDAKALRDALISKLYMRYWEPSSSCVRIVSYKTALEQGCQSLLLCGFVNGFVPVYDFFDQTAIPLQMQQRMYENYVEQLCHVVGKCSGQVAVSLFKVADLHLAQSLRVKSRRIVLSNGKRICKVEPSIFLDVMSD